MVAGLVLIGLALTIPAAAAPGAKKPPAFAGYCVSDDSGTGSGSCVLDEPEGQDPATFGKAAYGRTVVDDQDNLWFDLPDGLDPTEVQACVTRVAEAPTNPYVPAHADTCAGSSPDRAYESTGPPDKVVLDLDAFFAGVQGYVPGDGVWFALHVKAGGGTLMVVGASDPGGPVTRTLVVTKDVEPDSDPGSTFAFEVECTTTTLPGGNGSFNLGDGGTVALDGIADDDTCVVTEAAPVGSFTTTANGSPGRTATVSTSDGNAIAAFVNRPLVALTVTKDVVSPSEAEQFAFDLDCGTYALSPENNPAMPVTYVGGDAVFMLGRNGLMTFAGIPLGTTCTVAERFEGTTADDWTTTVQGSPGTAMTVVLDRERTVAFRNTLVSSTITTTPVPTTVATRVLGTTEAREIARTGSATGELALVGVFLLAGGAVMTRASRRRDAASA